jgi:cobalt-zinc-cadmium efflux system outer membrane protein
LGPTPFSALAEIFLMFSNSVLARTLCVALLMAGGSGASFAQTAQALTLEEALARAESNVPALVQAQAAVDAAEGRRQQAGLGPNPEVRLEVENFSGSGLYSGLDLAESTLAIGQTIELGGKREARVRAGEAEVSAAQLSARVARAELTVTVKSRFAAALASEAQVTLARGALGRANDLARSAQALVDAGREPPLRALRARTAVAEAQAELDRLIGADNAARAALAALLGDVVAPQRVVGSLSVLSKPAGVPDPMQSLDVRLAEAQGAAARAIVARERAAGSTDVTAEVGVRRFEEDRENAIVFGLSMPIPIFNQNQGNVAAANADVRAADSRRVQAIAEAVQRIRGAEDAFAAADRRVQTLEVIAGPTAQEALDLARAGFEAGRFSLLDVLDAEAAFASAQATLIEAQRDRAVAAAELERALAR